MGIKEFKVYTIECDGCGRDFFEDNEECCGLQDINEIALSETDWEKVGEKHFCFDCWEWNDMGEIVGKITPLSLRDLGEDK